MVKCRVEEISQHQHIKNGRRKCLHIKAHLYSFISFGCRIVLRIKQSANHSGNSLSQDRIYFTCFRLGESTQHRQPHHLSVIYFLSSRNVNWDLIRPWFQTLLDGFLLRKKRVYNLRLDAHHVRYNAAASSYHQLRKENWAAPSIILIKNSCSSLLMTRPYTN